jgi:RNA polymerase sigma-70 factor (ECF subfamily)
MANKTRQTLITRKEAEEIVQEAFVKAYRRLKQFQEHSQILTLLIEIVLNKSMRKMRG